MLKLAIVGQGTLRAATEECCRKYFHVCLPWTGADLLWVCYDTPIGSGDAPDVGWVLARVREDLRRLRPTPPVLISSQLPVGSTAKLEREFPSTTFAYSPENIRVATAATDFCSQARVIVGRRTVEHDALFQNLFAPFTSNLVFTDPETAEMAKHALNCYLGLSIAWINEIARLAAVVGADPAVISSALLSEPRISPKAPLRPGAPFGGGHLARDIQVLSRLADQYSVPAPLITHIMESNKS